MRRCCLGVWLLLLATSAIPAAEPPRFRFLKGETLRYHLVQTTKIVEAVVDDKTNTQVESATQTTVDLVRRWKVVDVDDRGVAVLEMSITSMRLERKNGDDVDTFDSSKPDDLNKSELAKHVGPVLATIRVDARGQLLEVKESKVMPAARFSADLPLKFHLPDSTPSPNETWQRHYDIQLDPPYGTGEKYAAAQTYVCQEPMSGLLVAALTTKVKELPANAADQIPLLPLMLEGSLYFHVEAGRYYAARLKATRELKNHHGDGSRYKFHMTYVEDLLPDK